MCASRILIVCLLVFVPGLVVASDRFDGTWHTKVTCPPKGNPEDFPWNFDSVIQNGNLRGVRGTVGQPGSFVLEGKVADDGSAKLNGTGIINSKQFARGIFTHKREEYRWDVKAKFKGSDGTGLTNEGAGIAGGPCTFEFMKQLVMINPGGR